MASASKTVREKSDPPLGTCWRWLTTHVTALAVVVPLTLNTGALAAPAAATANPAKAQPAAAPATTASPRPLVSTQQQQAAVRGSTAGLLTPAPVWSAGAQIGNYGGTGLSLQRLGVPGGGAVNANVGVEGGAIGVSGDYIWFASDQFHLLQLKANSDYNGMRGQLLLYFGGGLGVQNGLWVRVPIGVQYTMLRDPFQFYGGFALALGPFLKDDAPAPEAWLSLGMRVLL